MMALIARYTEFKRARRRIRPRAPDARRQLAGVAVALAVVVGLDLFSRYVLFVPNLGWSYLILTLGIAFWSGLYSALVTVGLLTAHVWLVHRFGIAPYGGGSIYGTSPPNLAREIRGTAIAFSFWAALVGLIQIRLRHAATREFDARASAEEAATGRQAAETDLRSSEAMRRLIVDASTDAVVVLDAEGRVSHWNPNAQALFGWTEEEAMGRTLTETVLPPRLGSLAVGERVETRAAKKDGGEIDVEASLVRQEREDGPATIAFFREIGERKRVEAAIRDINAELEARVLERTAQLKAANAELIGFNYSVSHDLRAPLRGIVANSRILVEEAGERLDAESRERLMRVEAAALKMAALIESLLQFSRVGQVALKVIEVDLSRRMEAIVEELRRGKEGEAMVEPGMVVRGDPELLGLVALNLLENAWKYVRAGETPRVEAGRTADGTFFVRDHGIGFDMQYEPKVWQPFERLHRDEEYPGTGIGLANCRRIVERHGGRMWAESAPGIGTTVYFTLPEG